MAQKIAVIGGDLRISKLVKMLSKDGLEVYTFGLEKSKEIIEDTKIQKCKSLQEATEKANIILGPMPFSSNGVEINTPFSNSKILVEELVKNLQEKILIVGSIPQQLYTTVSNNTKIIDLMKREELAVLNTIATVEGTIELAISNTDKILQESKVLILGFGRIGKVLAQKFTALSTKVTCAARKNEDFAWIRTYGYDAIDINRIGENLKEYEIIINTVPNIILTKERLKNVNKDALIIDLASKPGGVDQEAVKEMNLKFIWALALPGKVAPTTSAEFIKNTVYNILNEINK